MLLARPYDHLMRLQSELDQFFDPSPRLDATRATAWVPPVDVYEDAERLVFKIDLPDVRNEDLRLGTAGGVLTVEGSRRLEFEDSRNGYHRIERGVGRFARSFSLPDTVSSDDVQAELKNGVLRISLSKKRELQPRSIEIKAS